MYLRGVLSVWLDVGREFVVELLLLSRDGDVIPIGGHDDPLGPGQVHGV